MVRDKGRKKKTCCISDILNLKADMASGWLDLTVSGLSLSPLLVFGLRTFFWHQLLHSVSNMMVSISGIISFSLWPESKISSLVWQIQKILEGLWRAKLDHVLPSVARGQICYWKVSGGQKHFTLHLYFLLKYTNVFPSSKAHPQMYSNCRCYNYFNWYPFSLPPYY